MKYIKPIKIDYHNLVSSNIPVDDTPLTYNFGTTYAAGTKVLYIEESSFQEHFYTPTEYTSIHRIYQSVQANNVGHSVTDPAWWLDLGDVNRWKMFDQVVGTQTVSDTNYDFPNDPPQDNITVVLAPGAIDAIALLDLEAQEIRITMTDPVEGVVYSEIIDLILNTHVVDAYTYFFAPHISKQAVVILDIPQYANAETTIIIKNSFVAKCGTLVVGHQQEVGDTHYAPTVEITDYSKKEVDPVFGTVSILKRGYSKKMSCDLSIPNELVDYVQRSLAEQRSELLVWIGSDVGFVCMIIYGFYKSCPITISYKTHSICHLEVEGLV